MIPSRIWWSFFFGHAARGSSRRPWAGRRPAAVKAFRTAPGLRAGDGKRPTAGGPGGQAGGRPVIVPRHWFADGPAPQRSKRAADIRPSRGQETPHRGAIPAVPVGPGRRRAGAAGKAQFERSIRNGPPEVVICQTSPSLTK